MEHSMNDPPRAALSENHMDAVLSAARSGGEWAWELIYGDVAPSVLGYLRAKGVADSDDVLGEVFLQAVRNLGSFDGDYRGFRAWLLTIAHRRMVDDYRRRATRPRPAPNAELEARAPIGDLEDESLHRIQARSAVAAIRTLRPAQRDVLLLRLVADLSVQATASVLGKRPEAIKALQRRGLATLHEEFSKDPYPNGVPERLLK
jgi:RNA polymerase sigma factor (sigma-70 family)